MNAEKNLQRGAVAVLVAAVIPVMIGVAAFAVDVGYFHVVRNELQNDADAAALAGARYLYASTPSGPDWSLAAQKSQEAIGLNSAAGQALKDAQVQTGYWNLSNSVTGLQGLPMVPTVNDSPAVQVSLSKSTGQNQGPVTTFFARFWSVLSKPIQVSAVAGPSSPGTVNAAGLFPYAVSSCLYQKYWNSGITPPGPKIDPLTGKIFVFQLGSAYHYSDCDSGQWSSLDMKAPGANDLSNMIKTGNTLSMSIGDVAWVQDGSKTALYTAVHNCSAAGDKSCEYVVVPVINQLLIANSSPIQGFACLHILDAVGGSQKYIRAEMSTLCQSSFSGGVGPNYGVVSPPSLFK